MTDIRITRANVSANELVKQLNVKVLPSELITPHQMGLYSEDSFGTTDVKSLDLEKNAIDSSFASSQLLYEMMAGHAEQALNSEEWSFSAEQFFEDNPCYFTTDYVEGPYSREGFVFEDVMSLSFDRAHQESAALNETWSFSGSNQAVDTSISQDAVSLDSEASQSDLSLSSDQTWFGIDERVIDNELYSDDYFSDAYIRPDLQFIETVGLSMIRDEPEIMYVLEDVVKSAEMLMTEQPLTVESISVGTSFFFDDNPMYSSDYFLSVGPESYVRTGFYIGESLTFQIN